MEFTLNINVRLSADPALLAALGVSRSARTAIEGQGRPAEIPEEVAIEEPFAIATEDAAAGEPTKLELPGITPEDFRNAIDWESELRSMRTHMPTEMQDRLDEVLFRKREAKPVPIEAVLPTNLGGPRTEKAKSPAHDGEGRRKPPKGVPEGWLSIDRWKKVHHRSRGYVIEGVDSGRLESMRIGKRTYVKPYPELATAGRNRG